MLFPELFMLRWETVNRSVARGLVSRYAAILWDDINYDYENASIFTRDTVQLGFYLFRICTRKLSCVK